MRLASEWHELTKKAIYVEDKTLVGLTRRKVAGHICERLSDEHKRVTRAKRMHMPHAAEEIEALADKVANANKRLDALDEDKARRMTRVKNWR